jgi:hypothetical protein
MLLLSNITRSIDYRPCNGAVDADVAGPEAVADGAAAAREDEVMVVAAAVVVKELIHFCTGDLLNNSLL